MFLLKLYHETNPAEPVAAHLALDGRTRLGRDPEVEWVVPDPDRKISRTHLEITVAKGSLAVTPLGANGVYEESGERLPAGEPRPFHPGESLCFGKYRLLVETAPGQGRDDPLEGTMIAAPFGTELSVPASWNDPAPVPVEEESDSLIEAFCRGADLDVSAFAGEDATAVLERAGEIYRQMVLGLADLMQARSIVKRDHRLARTTIGAEHNNPFKWAPTRRLASDLLLRNDAAFLPGPQAARESFRDVKLHMLATLAGFRAATYAVANATKPAEIEARVRARKSMLQSQTAACWAEYVKCHEAFTRDSSAIDDAFAHAYEARRHELEGPPDAPPS